jgi:hypothetical protein
VKLVPLQGRARPLVLVLRLARAKRLELRLVKLVLVLVQRARSLVRRVLPPKVLPEARSVELESISLNCTDQTLTQGAAAEAGKGEGAAEGAAGGEVSQAGVYLVGLY